MQFLRTIITGHFFFCQFFYSKVYLGQNSTYNGQNITIEKSLLYLKKFVIRWKKNTNNHFFLMKKNALEN